MTTRIAILGLVAYSAMPLVASAQSTSDQATHTSTEDCAVIAAVGENRLKWREQSPGLAMYARTYGADCNWKAMGIKDIDIPPIGPGPYYEGVRFSFSKPEYSADGLRAKMTYTIGGSSSASSYFYSLTYCSAIKEGGQWRAYDCKPGPIT